MLASSSPFACGGARERDSQRVRGALSNGWELVGQPIFRAERRRHLGRGAGDDDHEARGVRKVRFRGLGMVMSAVAWR